MKPSILEINGLDGFLQTETIDFNKLTSRGLFGIFGPTGSGKSTILDAITLALYGRVARDTKSYINSDLDKAYIYFEFLSGNGNDEKKYIIERTIKRTQTGIQNTKVKLEIYDSKDNLLEVVEKRTLVEKELVENIVKLNFEDFIRTVVLPQGKFSEFLTLTGSERNNMLERILGLEEYGKSLTEKINSKKEATNNRLNHLNGELSRYSDYSPEKIDELKEKQKEILELESSLKIQLNSLEKEYKKYSQVHELQEELEDCLKNYEEISKNKDQISKSEEKLKKGKDALHISPYIDTFDSNLKEQEANKNMLDELVIKLKKLEMEKKSLQEDYNKAYDLKEIEHPKLLEKKLKIVRAIELESEKLEIQKQLIEEEEKFKYLKESIKSMQKKVKDKKDKKEKIDTRIKEIEMILTKKFISSSYRSKLIEGVDIEKRYNNLTKDLKEKEESYSETKDRIEDGKSKIEKLDKTLKILDVKLESNNQEYIFLKQILISKESSLKELTVEVEKIKEQSLARILSENLEKDSACPVCGSLIHPNIAKDIKNEDLNEKETYKEKLIMEIEELKGKLDVIDIMINHKALELKNLDAVYEVVSEDIWKERSEILKTNLENIQKEKLDIEKTHIKYTTLLQSIEEKVQETSQDKKKLQQEKNTLLKEYEDIKKALKVENIEDKYEQVKQLEIELEKLSDEINRNREELKIVEELKTKLENELNNFNTEIQVLESSIKTKKENINKSDTEIFRITGLESSIKLKREIETNIDEIINLEKQLKSKLESLKEEESKFRNQKNGCSELKEKLNITLKDMEEKISSLIKSYEFESIEQVKQSSIQKETINILERDIKAYKSKKDNIKSNISRIEKLLDGNSITTEALEKLNNQRIESGKRQEELLEEKGRVVEQLDEMNKNIKKIKEISKDIKKLEIRKDSLDEIGKITKGKRFVEFVSRSHLDYIARVATEKLKSITRGRYGLTLNRDNAFEVIDNYNGGVSRDCSSLSGGETFLTSLALALALSTKIQLKGDTSMEFFFLDEGFGTLDIETLDTAMTALENLYTENLSVGIISHVEEIKNRVPIKLMVSSPVPGVHGSQVKIVKT